MTVSESEGILRIEPTKIYVEVDPEIVALVRALLPSRMRTEFKLQRYAPHITVIRNEGFSARSDLDSKSIPFLYDPEPVVGETYSWLRVFAVDLLHIRQDLGLAPSSEWSRPPDGEECFHITIGNRKWLVP